jgi:hypothetical protein
MCIYRRNMHGGGFAYHVVRLVRWLPTVHTSQGTCGKQQYTQIDWGIPAHPNPANRLQVGSAFGDMEGQVIRWTAEVPSNVGPGDKDGRQPELSAKATP